MTQPKFLLLFLLLCPATLASAEKAASRECPEPALQKWLSACAARLQIRNARDASHTDLPRDPWAILSSSEVLMQAGPFLAERVVEECHAAELEDVAQSLPLANMPCDGAARREWLSGCVDEALGLIGKKRGEIPAFFHTDGGIATYGSMRYLLPRCPYLKLNVTFDCAHDSDGREIKSRDDLVLDVEPYLGLMLYD